MFRRLSAAVATSREGQQLAKIRPGSPAPAMGLNDMRTIVNLIAMAIICLTIFLIFAAIGPAKADALLLINTGPAHDM
jgi:hypothetical protein